MRAAFHRSLLLWFSAAIVILGSVSLASYLSTTALITTSKQLHTAQDATHLENELISTIKDAETGQRGYLLTGEERYLKPYENARQQINNLLRDLHSSYVSDTNVAPHLATLTTLIRAKMDELKATVDLVQAGKKQEALALVRTGQGRNLMQQIRQTAKLIDDYQSESINKLTRDLQQTGKAATATVAVGALISCVILIMVFSLIKNEIKERAQAEKNLQTSEERLRTVTESVIDAIMSIDHSHQVIFWNKGAVAMFGREPDEVIGQPLPHIIENVAGEEILLSYLHGDGKSVTSDLFGVRRDGQRFPCEITDSEWTSGNESFHTFAVRDITERHRAAAERTRINDELKQWVAHLERRQREMTVLSEMGELLQTCANHEEACAVIQKALQDIFPTRTTALSIMNASRDSVDRVLIRGEEGVYEQYFAPDNCWSLRLSRMHVVNDPRGALICNHFHSEPQGAFVCAPMISQGETIGVLHLLKSRISPWSNDELQLAKTVSEQISLALANLNLKEKLRNQSIRDPLTGLYNRRYLEESIERELHRAERTETQLGVLMLDIDYFKKYNDTLGHDAGDALLRQFGEFVQQHIRRSDIACRYGGEEFTVILPETSLEGALFRAEQLRSLAKELNFTYRDRAPQEITISLGVAVYPQHGTAREELFRAADDALYRAKHNGRNQVQVADSEAMATRKS